MFFRMHNNDFFIILYVVRNVYWKYRISPNFVESLVRLGDQLFIQLASLSVFQDQIDPPIVMEVSVHSNYMRMPENHGQENSALYFLFTQAAHLTSSEVDESMKSQVHIAENCHCKTASYLLYPIIEFTLLYLRCVWISISRRTWCSTSAELIWALKRTFIAMTYLDFFSLAR